MFYPVYRKTWYMQIQTVHPYAFLSEIRRVSCGKGSILRSIGLILELYYVNLGYGVQSDFQSVEIAVFLSFLF